jgi:hypothetical protein
VKRAACRWPPSSNPLEAPVPRPLQQIQPQVRFRMGYPEEPGPTAYRVAEKAGTAIGMAPWAHPQQARPFFVVNSAIRGHVAR